MQTLLSVLSAVLIVKMSEATNEVTRGHHFIPCEGGLDQLVCPGNRQCIHKQKVRHGIMLFYFVMLPLICIAHTCSKV